MTRSLLMKKWLCYILPLIPVFLLDIAVLPRYPVFGVHPTLLPLAVVAVAVFEGAFAGAAFGMGVGFLWSTAYAGVSGWQIFILAVTGMLVGVASRYGFGRSFLGFFLCAAGALLAQGLLQVLTLQFLRVASGQALLAVAVPEFFWSLVWSCAVYPLFRPVYRRVGGTKLAN